eukprot:CAMPEP_0174696780 /NCGR_PEP_ID=MMETSP1094-20130205/2836_1 /TAXON_ID=156173 /ORGANISM="Chrysochromulina brevifilum, Strain UTEX LB 985" /LENGTH=223 /DNA_ID=CAMNT_0015893633 /DNA_START=421 /DNA_END=1093 /DNA_ORIENTATION=-
MWQNGEVRNYFGEFRLLRESALVAIMLANRAERDVAQASKQAERSGGETPAGKQCEEQKEGDEEEEKAGIPMRYNEEEQEEEYEYMHERHEGYDSYEEQHADMYMQTDAEMHLHEEQHADIYMHADTANMHMHEEEHVEMYMHAEEEAHTHVEMHMHAEEEAKRVWLAQAALTCPSGAMGQGLGPRGALDIQATSRDPAALIQWLRSHLPTLSEFSIYDSALI